MIEAGRRIGMRLSQLKRGQGNRCKENGTQRRGFIDVRLFL
jgi:hypothetical protein